MTPAPATVWLWLLEVPSVKTAYLSNPSSDLWQVLIINDRCMSISWGWLVYRKRQVKQVVTATMPLTQFYFHLLPNRWAFNIYISYLINFKFYHFIYGRTSFLPKGFAFVWMISWTYFYLLKNLLLGKLKLTLWSKSQLYKSLGKKDTPW